MKENILKTMAYFDLFNMPLKEDEVARFLFASADGSVSEVLKELVNQNKVAQHGGYYYLADRSVDVVDKREAAYRRSLELMKTTRKWIKWLSAWPGVEMIAVCNTLAWLNAGDQSDVDLFIVTKPKMLWQTRFALASFLQIFRMRPQPYYQYGKICLSFLVPSDKLDLSSIAIDNDIYLSYWLRSLMPVYDPKNILNDVHQANQPLMTGQPHHDEMKDPFKMKGRLQRIVRTLLQPVRLIRRPLEAVTKRFQLKRFPPDIRQAADQDSTSVVISDHMLKFHTNDRREHYRDAWLSAGSRALSATASDQAGSLRA